MEKRSESDAVRLKNGKTVKIVNAASWLLEDANPIASP